jgi:hypothetical protein
MAAAQLLGRFPVVADHLADGRLGLTTPAQPDLIRRVPAPPSPPEPPASSSGLELAPPPLPPPLPPPPPRATVEPIAEATYVVRMTVTGAFKLTSRPCAPS